METNEAIRKGVRAIDQCHDRFEKSKPPVTDPNVLEEAFDRMQANGMNAEDVEKVMSTLDEVTQKRKLGFYDKMKKVNTNKRNVERAFLDEAYGFDEEKERAEIKDNDRSFIE